MLSHVRIHLEDVVCSLRLGCGMSVGAALSRTIAPFGWSFGITAAA
jgi:hypothetical protein